MHDQEAIEMMSRCKVEIVRQRQVIEQLRPKAEAYDAITQILGYLPQRSVGAGEDLAWLLDKRIERAKEELAEAQKVQPDLVRSAKTQQPLEF